MSQIRHAFDATRAACPLIAILRGITPDEVEDVGDALVDAGFRLIEVPLNSPQPLKSIERLASRYNGDVIVGAGTVLSSREVRAVREAGGRLIVSPNVEPSVVEAAVSGDMVSLPGFFTPSEAFRAIEAGAHGLKLFPAEAAGPGTLRAMRAVLPASLPIFVVGGICPETLEPWIEAGANGFGIGGSLYRPGIAIASISHSARAFIAALGEAGMMRIG